jgi:hypothetical protein
MKSFGNAVLVTTKSQSGRSSDRNGRSFSASITIGMPRSRAISANLMAALHGAIENLQVTNPGGCGRWATLGQGLLGMPTIEMEQCHVVQELGMNLILEDIYPRAPLSPRLASEHR